MVANDRTDAAPRSRAFAWGFAGSCRAVLCLQPFFQNIILSPIENVPATNFDHNISPFYAPCESPKETFTKLNFNSQTLAKFLMNFTFYF
jgi:hypothetical protein